MCDKKQKITQFEISSWEAEKCCFHANCMILMALIYASMVCVLCVHDLDRSLPSTEDTR